MTYLDAGEKEKTKMTDEVINVQQSPYNISSVEPIYKVDK